MHAFIFQPGIWLGQGKIVLSASPEKINFYTKWQITQAADKTLRVVQIVEMQGVEEHVVNIFNISEITNTSFIIEIENAFVGKVVGKGTVDDKTIAWEFGGDSSLEGHEKYQLQDNGEYTLHAEYLGSDGQKTTVEGVIWHQ